MSQDQQKTHQLLVSVPKLLQLRFAAPNPMKSATRPQFCSRWEWLMFSWFQRMVGEQDLHRSPGFLMNSLLLRFFLRSYHNIINGSHFWDHMDHSIWRQCITFFFGFGSARIFTSARRPDEFQVPIFFRSFSSFLPWLVKRQKEPWAFSLSSCCLVHCIPWSLTTPRWMGRCCTPKIPRPSWAKSSPCSSWTSWRGRRKAWRVWRLAGRFQKVLPSSSWLVCGMPLATSWRCCPWVPWRVASISSCCSRNFWSLLSWWCTLRAQCKVPWFRLCLKHFLAPTAVTGKHHES